jgi:hypothetical protein
MGSMRDSEGADHDALPAPLSPGTVPSPIAAGRALPIEVGPILRPSPAFLEFTRLIPKRLASL